jgi:hypothetical protein
VPSGHFNLDQPAVHLERIQISPPSDDGVIQVVGAAGAVTGGPDAVRLTLFHPVAMGTKYQVLHLGFGPHEHYYFEVLSVDLPVAADGSFGPATLGDKSRFAQHFDELDFMALAAGFPTGGTATATVP